MEMEERAQSVICRITLFNVFSIAGVSMGVGRVTTQSFKQNSEVGRFRSGGGGGVSLHPSTSF